MTEVRVSPDLRNATAFIMPLGGVGDAAAVDTLMRARGFLRRRVSESVNLKTMPQFTFRLDPSFAEADHIEALLRRPDVARDLQPDRPDASDGDRSANGHGEAMGGDHRGG